MAILTLNLPALVRDLLPRLLRRPRMKAWLLALLAPVASLYATFATYRTATTLDAHRSAQTKVLALLLNQRLSGGGLIYILNHAPLPYGFWLALDTDDPAEIGTGANTVGLYLDADLVPAAANFTVYIPTGLSYNAALLATLVDRYKLYGSTWDVATYIPGA